MSAIMEVTGLDEAAARALLAAHGTAEAAVNMYFSACTAVSEYDDNEGRGWTCFACDKAFTGLRYLEMHRRRYHPTPVDLAPCFGDEEKELLALVHASYDGDHGALGTILDVHRDAAKSGAFDVTRMPGGEYGEDWPLLVAVREVNVTCARMLLEHGSQVDVPIQRGGDSADLEALLQLAAGWAADQRGAGDEAVWSDGMIDADLPGELSLPPTPLEIACDCMDEETVELLLYHGADPHRPYPYGYTREECEPGEARLRDRIGARIEEARARWQGRGRAACGCPWHNWGPPRAADASHDLTCVATDGPEHEGHAPPPAAAALAPSMPPLPPKLSEKAQGKRRVGEN